MEHRDPSPTGTKASGYAGPEDGPFKCGNCVWYESGRNASLPSGECAHPKVKADPQVPKSPDGDGIVNRDGCCEYQRSKTKYGPQVTVAPYKSTIRRQ
jgi:hypothetical protein